MCYYCGNPIERHENVGNLFPKLEDEVLRANAGTNQELANYLSSGFWSDFGTTTRKYNLSNSGTFAKSGVLTYNTSGNNFDGNGLTNERANLIDEAFNLVEKVLGINFQLTTNSNADFRFGDEKITYHFRYENKGVPC